MKSILMLLLVAFFYSCGDSSGGSITNNDTNDDDYVKESEPEKKVVISESTTANFDTATSVITALNGKIEYVTIDNRKALLSYPTVALTKAWDETVLCGPKIDIATMYDAAKYSLEDLDSLSFMVKPVVNGEIASYFVEDTKKVGWEITAVKGEWTKQTLSLKNISTLAGEGGDITLSTSIISIACSDSFYIDELDLYFSKEEHKDDTSDSVTTSEKEDETNDTEPRTEISIDNFDKGFIGQSNLGAAFDTANTETYGLWYSWHGGDGDDEMRILPSEVEQFDFTNAISENGAHNGKSMHVTFVNGVDADEIYFAGIGVNLLKWFDPDENGLNDSSCYIDLSSVTKISFMAKGSGQIRFSISDYTSNYKYEGTDRFSYNRTSFNLTETWTKFEVDVEDLAPPVWSPQAKDELTWDDVKSQCSSVQWELVSDSDSPLEAESKHDLYLDDIVMHGVSGKEWNRPLIDSYLEP